MVMVLKSGFASLNLVNGACEFLFSACRLLTLLLVLRHIGLLL